MGCLNTCQKMTKVKKWFPMLPHRSCSCQFFPLTFGSISSMTKPTIAEQKSFSGPCFATYSISVCAFSRETVVLTEKEQSLPNNLLVKDKNYVEHHGRDINLHFVCVTNQWIPTMEEGSEKIGVVGKAWLADRCPPICSPTPPSQQDRQRKYDGKAYGVR